MQIWLLPALLLQILFLMSFHRVVFEADVFSIICFLLYVVQLSNCSSLINNAHLMEKFVS